MLSFALPSLRQTWLFSSVLKTTGCRSSLSGGQPGDMPAGRTRRGQNRWCSIRDNVSAIGPAGHEGAVLGRLMPDFAPAIANRLLLFPCRLIGDIEQVYAAGASPGHLQDGPVRIGGLLLGCSRRIFAHIQRVAERHIGHLPSRKYGRMRLAGKGQT